MKTIVTFSLGLIFSLFSYSQEFNLEGEWKLVQVFPHKDLNKEMNKVVQKSFKKMILKFDSNKYERIIMENERDKGNWFKNNKSYFFTSSQGKIEKLEIKFIKENKFVFTRPDKLSFIFKKINHNCKIADFKNSIDKVNGTEINKQLLIGKWYWLDSAELNGEGSMVIYHTENEPISFNFKEDTKFEHNAALGSKINGSWHLSKDLKLLIIESLNKEQLYKVTKLNNNELFIYNPVNETIDYYKKTM